MFGFGEEGIVVGWTDALNWGYVESFFYEFEVVFGLGFGQFEVNFLFGVLERLESLGLKFKVVVWLFDGIF